MGSSADESQKGAAAVQGFPEDQRNAPPLLEYPQETGADLPCLSDSMAPYVFYVGGLNMNQASNVAMRVVANAGATDVDRDRLVRGAYDWLYFVASKWSLKDAEDVVQEALTRALDAWPGISTWTHAQQRSWLFKVALRSLIDVRRKSETAERHKERAAVASAPDAAPNPQDIAADHAARGNRAVLFSHLSDEDRMVLHVWSEQHCHHITVKEAATQLHMTQDEYAAARRRIGRALLRHAGTLQMNLGDLVADQEPSLDVGSESQDGEGSDDNEEE